MESKWTPVLAHKFTIKLDTYYILCYSDYRSRITVNINDIPADCQLVKIKIDIASRTINLYGDGGELVQLIEADSDDFTKMCNFVNETLEDHPEKVEYVF